MVLSRLHRMVLRDLWFHFFAVALVLVTLVVGLKMMRYFALVVDGQIAMEHVWPIIASRVVESFSLILPFAAMTSVVMSFARLFQTHEAIVMNALGMGRVDFARMTLWFAVPVTLLTLLFSWSLTPKIMYLGELAYIQAKNEQRVELDQGRIQADSGRLIYVESRQGSELQGVNLRYQQDGQSYFVIAKTGRERFEGLYRHLDLYDGVRYREDVQSEETELMRFESLSVRLVNQNAQQAQSAQGRLGLAKFQPSEALISRTDLKAQAEWVWRLALPMSVLVLALIAVFMVPGNPRTGAMGFIPVVILIFLIYMQGLNTLKGVAIKGDLGHPASVFAVHLVALAVVAWLAYRSNHKVGV